MRINTARIKDTLYYAHEVKNGRFDGHLAQAHIQGMVSGLMACGHSYQKALDIMADAAREMGPDMMENVRLCLPEVWKADFK